MTTPKTRRQKVRAMAEQSASPEEAAVAKAMLAKTANTPEEKLEVIADDIRAEEGKGIDTDLAIGRLLNEARALITSDPLFGKWVAGQGFGFSRPKATRLMWGAANEDKVRGYLASRSTSNGKDLSVATVVEYLLAKPKPVADGSEDDDAGELIPVTDATPVDEAYAALREGVQAIVGTEEAPTNAFLTMHVDQLSKCAGFIKALATAYNAAKEARSA